MNFAKKLKELDACEGAIQWVGDKTFQQFWNTCVRIDWMLWLLFHYNKRLVVKCAAHFCREMLSYTKNLRFDMCDLSHAENCVNLCDKYANEEEVDETVYSELPRVRYYSESYSHDAIECLSSCVNACVRAGWKDDRCGDLSCLASEAAHCADNSLFYSSLVIKAIKGECFNISEKQHEFVKNIICVNELERWLGES